MALTEADVQARLASVVDPSTGRDFVSAKAIRKITIDGSDVAVDVVIGYPAKSQHAALKRLIADALAGLPGVGRVDVNLSQKITAHAVQRAIDLSRDKYCSVWHSLRRDIQFETTFEVRA